MNCALKYPQRLSHSTNRVCPKEVIGSWFNENGYDCKDIFIEFLQKRLDELPIPAGIGGGGGVGGGSDG